MVPETADDPLSGAKSTILGTMETVPEVVDPLSGAQNTILGMVPEVVESEFSFWYPGAQKGSPPNCTL